MNANMKRIYTVLSALAIFALALSALLVPSTALAAPLDKRGGNGGGGGTALVPLTQQEKDALASAILEEYKAMNVYQAAINQLGNLYPFSYIVRSEQQHVNNLIRQAQKYGVAVPANPGLNPPPTFATVQAACAAGVGAEIEDAALYDQLKLVTTHTDLLQVYTNLQSASLNNHLPAFQACD